MLEDIQNLKVGCDLCERGEVLEDSIAAVIQTPLTTKPDELPSDQCHNVHDRGKFLTFGNEDVQFGQRSTKGRERNRALNDSQFGQARQEIYPVI